MNIPPIITNNPHDFCIQEMSAMLGTPGRGPFLAVQRGAAPGDPRVRDCVFVLTQRGTWLHFYLFIALPADVRRRIAMSDTIEEMLARCEKQSGDVVVEDALSLPELLAEIGFTPGESDPSGRALFEHMRKLHANPPPSR